MKETELDIPDKIRCPLLSIPEEYELEDEEWLTENDKCRKHLCRAWSETNCNLNSFIDNYSINKFLDELTDILLIEQEILTIN